jgi:hypothetical protein
MSKIMRTLLMAGLAMGLAWRSICDRCLIGFVDEPARRDVRMLESPVK